MTLRTLPVRLAIAAIACAPFSSAYAAPFPEFEAKCGTAPFAPSIKQDVTLPADKVAELRKDVVDFIKASDQFQDCIAKLLDQGPEFKKTDDTPEKRMAIGKRFENEAAKIVDENQSEKERVGNEFNKLMDAIKANKPK